MRLRSIYDEGERTTGENIARGVQSGLDYYAGRRETARQEGNTVGAAGGVRLPDQPTPSIRQRIGGIGQRIGEMIHGSPGGPPVLRPTGTFVEQRPSRPGAMPMDEQGMGTPNPDDLVTDAIMGRPARGPVVQPTPPVGALPPSPRMMPGGLAGPSLATQDMYSQAAQQAAQQPERTFEYQGSDGARYQMPQTGERERGNRMLEYGAQTAMKEAADDRNDARTAQRSLEHDTRMADIYANRDETRGEQQRAHDERTAAMRARLATLTGAGRGNSPEALDIRRQLADLAVRREDRLATQGAAGLDARAAGIEQKGAVTDPRDRRRLDRNPAAKAANDTKLSRADSAAARVREDAGELRAKNTPATKPPRAPTLSAARTEQDRLMRRGLSQAQARANMRAAGWPIK